MLMVQFVDDSFTFQPDERGIASANAGLTSFCTNYRHRFQDGAKAPTVMAVGSPAPDPAACGEVAGVPVRGATQLEVLGIVIDAELSLEPLLGRACGTICKHKT